MGNLEKENFRNSDDIQVRSNLSGDASTNPYIDTYMNMIHEPHRTSHAALIHSGAAEFPE